MPNAEAIQQIPPPISFGLECPMCLWLRRLVFDLLVTWQSRMSADAPAQQEFANELGFCPLHTWQLAALSSPQGMSAGYPQLTERLRMVMEELCVADSEIHSLRELPAAILDCRICRAIVDAQTTYARTLAQAISGEQGRSAFAASAGVCLRHLSSVLDAADDADTRRFLVRKAAEHFGKLSDDMRRFAQKHRTMEKHLITRDEQSALANALNFVVGSKPLCVPWEFGEISY